MAADETILSAILAMSEAMLFDEQGLTLKLFNFNPTIRVGDKPIHGLE